MPTTILAARGTGNLATDERPENYMEGILWLTETKREAPVTAISAKIASEPTDSYTFNHFQMDVPTLVVYTNAGNLLSTDTVLTFDDGSSGGVSNNLRLNTFLFNTRTLERIRVTADPASASATVSVARSWGGTIAADLLNNDQWVIYSRASEDKATGPTMISDDPTKITNYTQTIRHPIDVSRRAVQEHLRTGSLYDRLAREQLIRTLGDIEGAFIYGEKVDAAGTATGQRLTTTGGLLEFTTTNLKDFAGTVTDASLLVELERIFRFSKVEEKLLLAGGTMLSTLERLAKLQGNPLVLLEPDRTFGLKIRTWHSTHGDIQIMYHPKFGRASEMADWGLVIDPQYLAYRYHSSGPDIDLVLDKTDDPSEDGFTDEWIADCGLQMGLEVCFGLWQNAAAAAI